MKEYEITFITKENLKEAPVKKEIEALGGKILNISSIGQKNFVYPIKKEKSGVYTTVVFEMDPQKLMDLNKKLGLKDEIIRHLIILYKAAKIEAPKLPKLPKPEKTLPKEEVKLPEPPKEIEKPKEIEPALKEKKATVKKVPKKKIEKPVIEAPKPSKETQEIEKEEVSEEERLKELDKKLDELLKE